MYIYFVIVVDLTVQYNKAPNTQYFILDAKTKYKARKKINNS